MGPFWRWNWPVRPPRTMPQASLFLPVLPAKLSKIDSASLHSDSDFSFLPRSSVSVPLPVCHLPALLCHSGYPRSLMVACRYVSFRLSASLSEVHSLGAYGGRSPSWPETALLAICFTSARQKQYSYCSSSCCKLDSQSAHLGNACHLAHSPRFAQEQDLDPYAFACVVQAICWLGNMQGHCQKVSFIITKTRILPLL